MSINDQENQERSEDRLKRIAILKNSILNYSWGSKTFIPKLIGLPGPVDQPMAKIWMGAHPKAPSRVIGPGKREISLIGLIQKAPDRILGKAVQERFGSHLPFLFKILAVGRPLSIQAHPNQKQARQGYARENKLKISLEARQRNYQDDHHKPEIICSLGSFWALIGFRPWREIIDLLKKNGLKKLAKEFRPGDLSSEPQALRSFFTHLIHLGKEQQRALVHEAVAKAASLKDPDRAAQWVVKLGRLFPDDIMALAPLFLNLVHLKAGEAAYVAPGELHAYLKGNAIELMANSDNSLRGGLTPKHVDSSELLKIVSFAGRPIPVLRPKARQEGERIYQTPAEEFQLSVIHLQSQRPFAGYTENRVTIMICTRGLARIRSSANRTAIPLSRGTAVVIPAGVGKYWIQGRAHIYKATVPRTDE